MFFNQHAALQLANGNLVLFDNGNARVEEGWGGGGTFSRGVEYALSFGSEGQGTASKVWELRVAYDSHQMSQGAVCELRKRVPMACEPRCAPAAQTLARQLTPRAHHFVRST